jgi:hypothetical protein
MKKPVPLFFVFFVLPILILSCDILRSSAFVVEAWGPAGNFYGDPGSIIPWLLFSHEPDRSSVEKSFSLTEDGSPVTGFFRWEGRRVGFIPAAPLKAEKDYVLSVAAEARDEWGLSMDEKFTGIFSTRSGRSRPSLVSVEPQAMGTMQEERGEVSLLFSEPVPLNSCIEYISFSPGMAGLWRVEGNAAIFTPSEKWKLGQRYELRVSSSFAGYTGLSMGREFVSVFTAGEDLEKPFLIAAYALNAAGTEEELVEDSPGLFLENSGWDRKTRLRLVFSEPVDTVSVLSCLSSEGAPSLVMEGFPGIREDIVFGMGEGPEYESRFLLRLSAGVRDAAGNESSGVLVFRIFADGPHSKPPRLIGMRLPMVPGGTTPEEQELLDFGIDTLFENLPVGNEEDRFPFGVPVPLWIELYFDTAPETTVDALSLMGLFRVEAGEKVLTFSAQSISESDFSVSGPRPGWESYRRLEIRGLLTNKANPGMVNFIVGAGLQDKLGNRNDASFCISLLK